MNASNYKSMRSIRVITAVFLAGLLCWAQEDLPDQVFRTGTNVVQVPVTVKDGSGRFVNGLQAGNFHLYDNGKLQRADLDVEFTPLSMVVAIQRNNRTEAVLPQIKKIGPMLEQLVLGDQGEAALLAFDHRIEVIQDFTSSGIEFSQALEKLRPGSQTAVVVDAVMEAARMLRRRPENRRRVILLISETKDRGSEGRIRDTLLEVEFGNIDVYTVNMNRVLTALTTRRDPAPSDKFPVAARTMPGVAPHTPTEVSRSGLDQTLDFKPIIGEIFSQVHALFVPNHAEILTQYTGGREYSFSNLTGLESALTDIGQELHNQYVLSYTPNNLDEAGYHDITVEVTRPGLEIRARPGYWMAYKPATGP